jgi:hypothetical protein
MLPDLLKIVSAKLLTSYSTLPIYASIATVFLLIKSRIPVIVLTSSGAKTPVDLLMNF